MRTVTSHLWHLCLRVEGGFDSTLCPMPLKLESQEPFSAIIIMTLLCVSRGTSYSSMNSLIFCTIALVRVYMFDNIVRLDEREIQRRVWRNFSIVTDHSRTVEKGGKVEKGPHSDDDHEKNSVSSAGSGVFLGYQPQHVSK